MGDPEAQRRGQGGTPSRRQATCVPYDPSFEMPDEGGAGSSSRRNASTSIDNVRLPNQVPKTSLMVGPSLCEALRMSLPQRSPRISQPMLVTFDISCGDDLLPGHTFVARGLADEGRSRDDLRGAQTLHDECQMVDLVYELVPGVEAAEAPTGTAVCRPTSPNTRTA